MKLNVVGKIILGFGLFGGLLLFTNVIAYFGLADIQRSADAVVEQKMPVQSKMLGVQTGILSLGKISTNGYHQDDLERLQKNQQTYQAASDAFEGELEQLRVLLSALEKQVTLDDADAKRYIAQSRAMYQSRVEQLALERRIAEKLDALLFMSDEASALMMDLGYIESDSPNLDTLIGTGTNIDNKLIPFANSAREYVKITDAEQSETIRGDMEFAISNIDADVAYLNRLGDEIDTDGAVDSFNEQFAAMQAALNGADGLFALQQRNIALIEQAREQMASAEAALESAIAVFSTLFKTINDDTLSGQNAILDAVQSNIWKSIVIMVIGLGAVVALGSLAARSIGRPLSRINHSLSIISRGNLTHKVDTGNSNDEFAELASNVNQLSASLHQVVSQILASEAQLEAATQSSVSLGEKTLEQVDQQRQQVNTTASNTQVVRDTSQNNLKQIRVALHQLDEVNQQSSQTASLVEQSKTQINEQADQADKSSAIIHRLEDNSRKIGSILDVIKTIAEQTNLLALNAAIEAARAGEQGRGFAVVADEVRTLATRTHDSTEEIETMIATLQRDAEEAVQAISVGSQQAQQSVELIQDVYQQVRHISEITTSLTDVNQQIVNDTNAQDTLLQTINDSLARVVELAEQSAGTTKQANQATQQVDRAMTDLKLAVEKFTL